MWSARMVLIQHFSVNTEENNRNIKKKKSMWLVRMCTGFSCGCVSCGGCFASVPAPWRQEETRDCSPTPQAVRSHEGICHNPHTSTTQSSWCAKSWNHSYLPRKRNISEGWHNLGQLSEFNQSHFWLSLFLFDFLVFKLKAWSFETVKGVQYWICRCAHGS